MPKHTGKPKRRLKNFDFSAPGAHVALVDAAANGTEILVMKRFSDMERFDPETESFVKLQESGLRIDMSLEDILLLFTDMFASDIETLTDSITKSADGRELVESLKTNDSFTRSNEFQESLAKLDKGGMEDLRKIAEIIKGFLDRGIGSPSNLMEKSEMTDEERLAAEAKADLEKKEADELAAKEASDAADVQKSLDENKATIEKQAGEIAALRKVEDDRQTAAFVVKAAGFKPLGLPEVAEGEDAVADFATAMKTLHDANPEAYAKVESVLTKALDTVSKGDAFKEVGSDGEPVVTDTAAKLSKAADALIEADPKLTREAAIAKAVQNDESLYEG